MSFKRSFRGLTVLVLACFIGCASVPDVEKEVCNVVAVWDLVNRHPGSATSDPGDLLTATVIETLNDSDVYQVVERERLILVYEELNQGTNAIVDESTHLRIGKILGVRCMVFGSYFVVADNMVLDLQLVEVESGNILKTTQKKSSNGEVSEWLNIAQEAARELIKPHRLNRP